MSREEKQIEEMANDYYEAMLKARGTLGSMNEGAPKWYAKELHKAGYRKASDVAEEIFAEIEKALSNARYISKTSRKTVKVEELKEQAEWILHEAVLQIIEPIKKKYAESEDGE